ncbi:MAG: cytochrome c oxidase subunit II [Lysobacterales bacterium RIFOXYD1_FULL_69_11]|nr:MAG: cytochrome c oxidase subunit II [Xanthomonadales bacterium RIFOXYA1_FULL_69_10]OHE86573.1 MAG: cytochrome c oxidase subunit II [Xanthomonadales bacterium RIFOXYD1_FULL_69_11]
MPLQAMRIPALAAGACAASGCRGVQSALDPAGPAAATIAQTWWLMAAGATLVLALVLALLWYTLARRQDGADFRHGTRVIVLGGLVLPTAALIALLVYGTDAGRRVMAMDEAVDLVVEVEGRQWFWTFHYLDDGGARVASTVNTLALPRGRMVEFRVSSVDVIHSFWIPRLGGKIDAIPGRTNTLRLRADLEGRMRGQCAEFCGLQHARMAFDVVSWPGERFDAWLADDARPSPTPSPPPVELPAARTPATPSQSTGTPTQ